MYVWQNSEYASDIGTKTKSLFIKFWTYSIRCINLEFIWCTEFDVLNLELTQPAFTCSKLAKETLEQGVKYVQS